MDFNKLCMGCMQELDDDAKFCRLCGYKIDTPNSSRGLQPQTILNGKYLVGKVIGEGGFGITYIAFDLVLNHRVAIKEYFPSELVTRDTSTGAQTSLTVLTGSKEEQYKKGIDRFIREAGNLAKFNNLSGIVSVKEFFYENNTAYMVMEYIDGVTLSEYLNDNDGKLPYTKVIEMMDPVMDSLEKVHEAGIIHRDISPDNIMVTNDGKMKLIDFGAARIVDNNDVKSLTVILKHGYAPEEQYQPDGNQGAWTDIYALASTMYRMITGTVPQESTDRVLNGDKVVAVNKLVSDVPKKISDAIMHGLAVKVSDRPQKISDFKTELTTGRRVKPAFCFGIAAVIIAMIAVVGILLSRSGNKEGVVEADNSEETVIEQSVQANESQDVSTTAEEVPQEEPLNEKPESELISMIEEASGQKVAFSEYEDFDEDGYKELYSLTVPQSNNEESKGDSGQIWYADVEEAVRVMDTEASSEYVYSEDSKCGLLHFGESTHFYIENQAGDSDSESLSFGVVDDNPKLIYQGNAKFSRRDETVFLENQSLYNNQTGQEQQGRCKVLYMDGQYLGCGLSPMTAAQFNSIPGLTAEFEKAENQLLENYASYPYHYYENIYYCADDCIYVNTICLKTEDNYNEINSSWNKEKKLAEIDHVNCTLAFTRNEERFSFNEISEISPATTSFLPIFYKTQDFWNWDNIDTKSMSDEEAQDALMKRLMTHFLMQDEELDEFWNTDCLSDSEIEDFNNDGSKDLFAYINSGTSDWSTILGIYCINDDGIVTLCQEKAFDSYVSSITEYTFGKTHMYGFWINNQLDSDSFLYEACNGGVIQYDQLWAAKEENSPYFKTSLTLGTNSEGITLNTYWDVIYDMQKDKIVEGDINQMADSFIDSAQIWFVDGRFVECASIKIEEEEFAKMNGAQEIISKIDKYAEGVLLNNRSYSWDGTYNMNGEISDINDFGIESILYCSDGYIYINYLPIRNYAKYGDVGERNISTLPSVVIKVGINDNKVEMVDTYCAYKVDRLTRFQPLYPSYDSLFNGNAGVINEETAKQNE